MHKISASCLNRLTHRRAETKIHSNRGGSAEVRSRAAKAPIGPGFNFQARVLQESVLTRCEGLLLFKTSGAVPWNRGTRKLARKGTSCDDHSNGDNGAYSFCRVKNVKREKSLREKFKSCLTNLAHLCMKWAVFQTVCFWKLQKFLEGSCL